MLRKIIISAMMLVALTVSAQTEGEDVGLTASKCFAEGPTTVFTLLDNNTRLDMLDYFHAGLERESTNAAEGPCRVTSETPYSVHYLGGTGSKYELFVLNPTSSAPIIGLIETVETPIDDSSVTFYSSRWHKIISTIMPEPTLADWLTADGKKHREEVEMALPFIMASYNYDPETKQMSVTNNMAQYYLTTDTPQALSYVKDKLVYNWDGKKFKLQK